MSYWHFIAVVPILGLLLACGSGRDASSDHTNQASGNHLMPEDTIGLTTPPNSNYSVGRVYVDSVTEFTHDGKHLLKISGMLPDGCSQLLDIDYAIKQDELHLELQSWRPSDAMCTQALVEFTHISDIIDSTRLAALRHYIIDGQKSELRPAAQ